MSEMTTKDKILDTAERLFATNGFAATSLRAIIKEAGVNTASVHYHFGSKEGLIEAVMRRRAEPVNSERLGRLDDLEARHPDGAIPLEAIIEAFLVPALERLRPAKGGELLPHLFGRAIAEPDEKLRGIIYDIFGEVFKRFVAAFTRALPDIPPQDLHWRMHFMIGAMVFTVIGPRIQQEPRGARGAAPADMMSRLVDFVAAGMRSPAAHPTGGDRR